MTKKTWKRKVKEKKQRLPEQRNADQSGLLALVRLPLG